MKARTDYLEKQKGIAQRKLSDNLSGLEYSKEKSTKLIDEIHLLEQWIKELKGHYKQAI